MTKRRVSWSRRLASRSMRTTARTFPGIPTRKSAIANGRSQRRREASASAATASAGSVIAATRYA